MTRSLVPSKGRLPQFFGEFEREVENLFDQFFTNGNAARGIQASRPPDHGCRDRKRVRDRSGPARRQA